MEGRRELKRELFAFLPPKPPQVLLSEPREPLPGMQGLQLSWWGVLQPHGERKAETGHVSFMLCTAEIFSRGAGTNPHCALGKGWGWTLSGSTSPVLWLSLQDGLFFVPPSSSCCPEQQNQCKTFTGVWPCPREEGVVESFPQVT